MSVSLSACWPWLDAVGWTLLHFLWQGLAIGAGFAVVRASLPRIGCNARYIAGLVAMALLALCPVLTFIGLLRDRQEVAVATARTLDLVVAGGSGGVGSAGDLIMAAGVDRVLPWLALLWITGVVLVAARTWYHWFELSSIARHCAVPHKALDLALHRVMLQVRHLRRIRVLVSERIDTPTLIGWLKPVILLPAAVALGFAPDQIELILAHEISHLRRYDHLVNLVQTLIETLLFYHPVVHWISREIRNERELCCDNLVLRLTASEPRRYARTLTDLEELRQPPTRLALAVTDGVLLDRVRSIVGVPAARLVFPRPASVPLSLAAIALFVAWAASVQVKQADFEEAASHINALAVDWLPTAKRWVLPATALAIPFTRLRFVVMPIPRIRPEPSGSVHGPSGETNRIGEGLPIAGRVPSPVSTENLRVKTALVPTRPEFADLAPIKPLALAVPPAPTLVTPEPVHIVTPEYPAGIRQHRAETVQARFSIAPDGSVRNIEVDHPGAVDAVFARAAERALAQWHFRPLVAKDLSTRYEQTFVFRVGDAERAAGEDCVNSTGSHICRHAWTALPVGGYTHSARMMSSSPKGTSR